MKSAMTKFILLAFVTTVNYAGTCELITNHNQFVFYDNPLDPALTLTLGPSYTGKVSYNGRTASTSVKCEGDVVYTSWNSNHLQGQLSGHLNVTSLRGYRIIYVYGDMNGKPIPFDTMSTRIYGSGGH